MVPREQEVQEVQEAQGAQAELPAQEVPLAVLQADSAPLPPRQPPSPWLDAGST